MSVRSIIWTRKSNGRSYRQMLWLMSQLPRKAPMNASCRGMWSSISGELTFTTNFRRVSCFSRVSPSTTALLRARS